MLGVLARHGRLQQCRAMPNQENAVTITMKPLYCSLPYAASMYDGLILLAKAMQKANAINLKKLKPLKPVLAAFSYQSVADSDACDDQHKLKNAPSSVYAFPPDQLVALN